MKTKTDSDFREFFLGMNEIEKSIYAKQAGTTAHYIQTHLVTRYKVPRRRLMQGLADASNGRFSITDLTNFFYEESEVSA